MTTTSRPFSWESRSSEIDEARRSVTRRRGSATTGRTHFRLASGIAETNNGLVQSASYNEAWANFMRRGFGVAHDSYDAAWSRWIKSNEQEQSNVFESVPREALKPIMSRLPIDSAEDPDTAAENPTSTDNLDYITIKSRGMHEDAQDLLKQGIKYTRARLPVIDDESLSLWKVLHSLRSISDDYADGYEVSHKRSSTQAPHPIAEDMDASQCPAFSSVDSPSSQSSLALIKRLFNWDQLPDLPIEDEYTWYGVAFRSKRRPGSESTNFYEADRLSHEEAVDSGGLLMYWYGAPSSKTGHNLATCVWTSRQDAIRASSLPLHARAAAHSSKAYESFELNRYALVKVRGERKLHVQAWSE